jgi:4-alpha-glucanotransferase
MLISRASGILLHPTSLPGPHGIGSLGAEAFRFVDFLTEAGQRLWQVLPLGPTGYGNSPYQSFSSQAGNHLLIDPDGLAAHGFLPDSGGAAAIPAFPAGRVDYGAVIAYKEEILRRSWTHFSAGGTPAFAGAAFREFCARQASWLEDFALFMALKAHFGPRGRNVWSRWPRELAGRRPEALASWRQRLGEEIRAVKFQQFLFHLQWSRLKAYANRRGIAVVGDIPIYVAYDSADVWAHQELFCLDEQGRPALVGGVPPDYFSRTGQLWGNPLYDWERLQRENYRFWVERVRASLRLFDIIRLDHFRGFQAYYAVKAGSKTAVRGRWLPGPGEALFAVLQEALGPLPFIAEDLGVITPEVGALKRRLGFPGMKVLQFAFTRDPANPFLPHNHDPDCVVYTGTHDNDTTLSWYAGQDKQVRDQVRRYLGRDGHDIVWDLIRAAQASTARAAIIPLQDVLVLGTEARMNLPSRAEGNWEWRLPADRLTPMLAQRLRELSELYGRLLPGGAWCRAGRAGGVRERPGAG